MKQKHLQPSCDCGRSSPYALCCGRWHAGLATTDFPDDPETLMRSRYSAYVRGLEAYLLETWYPASRPARLNLDGEPTPKWLGLDVLRVVWQPGEVSGIVEFRARYRVAGRAHRLHETSRFVLEGGRWYYVAAM